MEGRVVDAPLRGSNVFIDLNGNSVQDSDEPNGTSDANGFFIVENTVTEGAPKIISIGGLHGTVHHISQTTVTVKLSEGVFVPFEKDAIRSVTKVGKGKQKEEPEEVESSDDKEMTDENRYR